MHLTNARCNHCGGNIMFGGNKSTMISCLQCGRPYRPTTTPKADEPLTRALAKQVGRVRYH